MPEYDKKTKRHYLKKGDKIEARPVTLEYTGNDYRLSDCTDAELEYWDAGSERSHGIRYAWDLPKRNPRYGMPYFEK
jgi:hypothetical protein